MAAKPVKIAWVSDSSDLRSDVDKIGSSFDGAAADAAAAGGKIDGALDSTAGHADAVASKGAQAAGALTGLGDLVGGPFGAAMMAGGVGMQAFADAGDLVNVVTESAIFRKLKDTAVTIAHTAASIAASAAQKAMAAAQWLVNAAMSANPIGLVVLAIVALVAGLIVAYKKSDTFREIVNRAFSVVKSAAEAVASFFTDKIPAAFDAVLGAAKKVKGWIGDHWPEILAVLTGPFGLAALLISRKWDDIQAGATAVKHWITGKLDDVVEYVRGLPARITTAAAGMFDGIKDAFRSAINWVIRAWNGLEFTMPSVNTHIPGVGTVGGFTLGTPNIPELATGGVVTRRTLAWIGEDGPEAVIPLDRMGFGGTYVKVEVNVGPTADKVSIGREIQSALDAYFAVGGRARA